MPQGRYRVSDPEDGTPLGEERFQCAPGPAGWRYTGTLTGPDGAQLSSTDLTLDAIGRPIRVELRAGGWQFRGAALDGLTWVRMAADGSAADEGNARASTFSGPSPGFLVAVARLLGPGRDPAGDRPRTAQLQLVTVTPPALGPRTRLERWTHLGSETHPTDLRPLVVDAYEVTDLETGERRQVHLAGDVVLAAPGVELLALDSPPSTFDPRDPAGGPGPT
ncbi:hypothetical protein RM844_31180 [Streptomyces sp. DSM 44915]|uniref:Uncharacterized protein n=1 Tax=Streptomyces chisholmiae TaxID=3075540 RepID=A0ABU2K2I0_9ACTN|nr:hypothetical protein [Streptomyces sp. DSM 44915]MDT0270743.1 hypothetical protein [Streptomyces sp. DSM 44915]